MDQNLEKIEDDVGLDGNIKMEQDYSNTVNEQLPEIKKLAEQGNLALALEQIQNLEKQTRAGADLASTKKLLLEAVRLCAHDFKTLGEQVVLFSKKRGQFKQATSSMVQEAMSFLDKAPNLETKLELIHTLRAVTEGKIFVEIERARLTRMLSKIREDEGKIKEASDILQQLQVETFGSMEKEEKADFLLEQMRLCLANKDYMRTQLVSKKISTKFFEKPEFTELKLRYYRLMIKYDVHEEEYMQVCKHYYEIFKTPAIQQNEHEWKQVLANLVIYAVLTSFDNEQSDFINRLSHEKKLEHLPLFKSFLKHFITPELSDWSDIEITYKPIFLATSCFGVDGISREEQWTIVRGRVIEHNIRVISKCYSRIRVAKLSHLLQLVDKEAEEYLSKLVISKTIFAKIDRPAGIVNFTPTKTPNEILNEWSLSVNSLLSVIEETVHLITKEEMVHKITQVK